MNRWASTSAVPVWDRPSEMEMKDLTNHAAGKVLFDMDYTIRIERHPNHLPLVSVKTEYRRI